MARRHRHRVVVDKAGSLSREFRRGADGGFLNLRHAEARRLDEFEILSRSGIMMMSSVNFNLHVSHLNDIEIPDNSVELLANDG